MSKLYVDVKATKPGDDTNAIQVGVDYCKRARGIEVTTYPCKRGDGMVTICISTMFSPPRETLWPMGRDNKKKVEAWCVTAKEQVDAKHGPVWDLVLATCKQHGLTLADEPAPVSEGLDWPGIIAEIEAAEWSYWGDGKDRRQVELSSPTSEVSPSELRTAIKEATERGYEIDTDPDQSIILVQYRAKQ